MTGVIRRGAWLGLSYALVVLLQRSAEATTMGMFVERLGAERLPWAFLVVAVLDVPLAMGYRFVARRAGHGRLLVWLAGLLTLGIGGANAVAMSHPVAGMFLGFLVAAVGSAFLSIHWGVVMLDMFTASESRRAFPWIYAAGQGGSFVAGAFMAVSAKQPGWMSAGVLAMATLALGIVMVVVERLEEGVAVRQGASASVGEMGDEEPSGGRTVRERGRFTVLGNRLVQAIALSTVMMVLLRLVLRTVYGAGLQRVSEAGRSVVAVLGVYTMVASVAGVLLQVTVTPVALRRWGVGRLNLGYGVALLLSFVGLGAGQSSNLASVHVLTAAGGRFADLELKAVMKTPLSVMFYDALAQDERAAGRALVLGTVAPAASVGGSLVLVSIVGSGVTMSSLAWMGMAGAVAYVVLCWRQAKAYREELGRRVLTWARLRESSCSLERAMHLASVSDDKRIEHLAREARREHGT